MLKKYYNYFPLVIALISFLFLQLLVFNKGLNFRDEGFLINNAIRILDGEIPYKDFFLTTTPGTYYLQSLVFKFFGIHVIFDRFLYMFFVVVLLTILNLLLDKINLIFKTLILLLITFTFTGIGTFAFYNIEGLVLFLLAIYFYIKARDSKSKIFFVGIVLGLLFIFKQSYGIYALGVFVSLFFINNLRNAVRKILYMLSGYMVIIIPFVGYLIWNKAFLQFIYFAFIFAQEVKGHRSPFILTSLLFIPLFLIILYIIKRLPLRKAFIFLGIFMLGFFILYIRISPARLGRLSTYIKDPLIYYYGFLLSFPIFIFSQFIKLKNNNIFVYSACALSFFLASASSGRDFTTVIIMLPLIILLCTELLSITHKNIFVLAIVIYSFFPLVFFGVSIKNLLTPVNYTKLELPQFEEILLPQETARDVKLIVKYIQKESDEKDSILCFPYCPLINVLAQRKSGSYFSFFYPETIRIKDQNRVINDLTKNRTKIIILQKTGKIEKEALYENKRLSLLNEYFISDFIPVFSSLNFVIYQKRE